jgi:hypothetical protein
MNDLNSIEPADNGPTMATIDYLNLKTDEKSGVLIEDGASKKSVSVVRNKNFEEF